MKAIKNAVLLLGVGITTCSCDQLEKTIDARVDAKLASALQTQNERIDKLESDLSDAKFETSSVKDDLNDQKEGAAYIDTDESAGYGVANTKYGPFLVSSKGLTPYLDGYKLKVEIGNMTSATFRGAKITTKWSLPFDVKNIKAYMESKKEKVTSTTKDFKPGFYTVVELTLTPAKPEEIKSLSVGLEFDRLSLYVPK